MSQLPICLVPSRVAYLPDANDSHVILRLPTTVGTVPSQKTGRESAEIRRSAGSRFEGHASLGNPASKTPHQVRSKGFWKIFLCLVLLLLTYGAGIAADWLQSERFEILFWAGVRAKLLAATPNYPTSGNTKDAF